MNDQNHDRLDSGEFSGTSVTRAAPIHKQVAEQIRLAIAENRLIPGRIISERELSLATGASRPSVREAIRELEADGLVKSRRGLGVEVIELSETEARDVYEVRAVLESMATRLFTTRASAEQVAALAATVEQMEASTSDVVLLLGHKRAYSQILVEGAGNLALRRALERLHLQVALLRRKSLSAPGRPQTSVGELRSILDAIKRGDADQAGSLAADHVRAAMAAALSVVADEEEPSTDF